MALVALLVIALVCLAVGLVLPSVAWLIASLIATAGAAFLLVKARSTILAPRAAGPGLDGVRTDPDAVRTDPDAVRTDPDKDPDPGATSILPRVDDAAETATTTVLPPVRTVDAPAGEPSSDEAADARTAGATGAQSEADAAADPDFAGGADDVWVIDGRPRYHVRKCVIIQGQDAEPIPFDQAVEDGFMPCSLCEPQLAGAASHNA